MPRFIVKDSFYNKAKKEGFRARSAYKLDEIQQRFRLIRKGDAVLDLGAAPGSWLQIESVLVGEKGLVMGIDMLPIEPLPMTNVILKKGDIRQLDVGELLSDSGIPAFDVITSDIAPNLSGIKDVDDANVRDLLAAVLGAVRRGLKKQGNFLIKLFFSPDLREVTADLKPLFTNVTVFKPKASRGASSEIYLVCTGRR
jgi:23S rRNA (uridine2552-2'-O)-methyltransferase